MSMKIGENYPGCSTEYFEKMQSKAEPVKETEKQVNGIICQKPSFSRTVTESISLRVSKCVRREYTNIQKGTEDLCCKLRYTLPMEALS